MKSKAKDFVFPYEFSIRSEEEFDKEKIWYYLQNMIRHLSIHEGRIQELENKKALENRISFMKQSLGWLGHSGAVIITSSPEEILQQEWLNKKTRALAELAELIGNIDQEFDDLDIRLELFISLKGKLAELIPLARKFEDKYFKQMAIILHDSVKNAYAEEQDRSCLKGILQVLEIMKKEELAQPDIFECDRILLHHKLDMIPALEVENE